MTGREKLERGWRSGGVLPTALWPFSLGFRAAVAGRRLGYRLGAWRSERPGVAVVSVGNLTVGGTGKTPMAIHLSHCLIAMGRKPAILTRGYGGQLGRGPRLVGRAGQALATAEQAGDEALVLAERGGGLVVGGSDRVAAAALALSEGADVIVLDDGFQHWRIQRDLDLVLVDGNSGFGNGRLLPAGPLREGLSALRRAHAILVTKAPASPALRSRLERRAPGVPLLRARLVARDLVRFEGGIRNTEPLGELLGRRVVLLSAIADPTSFYALAGELDIRTEDVLEFSDHHVFTQADWQRIMQVSGQADYVLCTEKDLAKLRHLPFARGRLVALVVGVEMEADDSAVLARLLVDRLGAIEPRATGSR